MELAEEKGPCRCEPKGDSLEQRPLDLQDLQNLKLNRSGSAIVIILCKKDFFNNVTPHAGESPDGVVGVEGVEGVDGVDGVPGVPVEKRKPPPRIMNMMKDNALKFMSRVKERMAKTKKGEPVGETDATEVTELDDTDAEAVHTTEEQLETEQRNSLIPIDEAESELESQPSAKPCVCAEKKRKSEYSRRGPHLRLSDLESGSSGSSSSTSSFAELTAYHGHSRIRKRANAACVRNVLSNIFGTELDEVDNVELRNISGSRYPQEMPVSRRRQYRASPQRRRSTPSPQHQKYGRRSMDEGACCRFPSYHAIRGCPICVVCMNCGRKRKHQNKKNCCC